VESPNIVGKVLYPIFSFEKTREADFKNQKIGSGPFGLT
jgi:hypothetical protein